MHLHALPASLALLVLTHAFPQRPPHQLFLSPSNIEDSKSSSSPLPLLIWHGLGDQFDNDGLQGSGALARDIHPGTHVYYIRLDDTGSEDKKATFFGNVTDQITQVCAALAAEPSLQKPQYRDARGRLRADALGFSQGGQFLRGLVQRCDGLSVRTLMTFGSQHNGISAFQTCAPLDFLCKGALALAKSNVWTDYVQSHLVPAQYYRSTNESTGLGSDEYLEHSNFLADANNERSVKNETYAERIAALDTFVMYVFEEDETVLPKESGWFAEVNATDGEVVPLRNRTMYKEDWLGLKKLDEKDGLVFETTGGGHMQLNDKTLRQAFKKYFGPERTAAATGTATSQYGSWEYVAYPWRTVTQRWGGLLNQLLASPPCRARVV